MAILNTQVGPQVVADGSNPIARSTRSGEVAVSDTHGRYQEAVLRGSVYLAANQAGIATQAGLSATTPIFTLLNPFGSNKNLVLLDICVSQTAVLGAAGYCAIWLAANFSPTQAAPTSTTALTVRNAVIGNGATGAGQAFSVATLATAPVVIRQLGQTFFGTAAVTEGGVAMVKDEVGGAVVLAPGIYVSVQTSVAATLAVSMTWEEVPV